MLPVGASEADGAWASEGDAVAGAAVANRAEVQRARARAILIVGDIECGIAAERDAAEIERIGIVRADVLPPVTFSVPVAHGQTCPSSTDDIPVTSIVELLVTLTALLNVNAVVDDFDARDPRRDSASRDLPVSDRLERASAQALQTA